jgi:uncharacterized protein YdeI (YjbR/CyaY-like superfamily)
MTKLQPKTNNSHETISPESREQWRQWLAKNHASAARVWLLIPKKSRSQKGVNLEAAVEEALCFGWIDSKQNPVNQKSYRLMFTPRKPNSIWSASNKQRVEKLIAQGLMTTAGLEKVEAAKKNGSWNALDNVEALKLPFDLQTALSLNPSAQKNFENFTISVKKQLLWWIQSAKRPQTRVDRIAKTVAEAEKGKRNPF